MRWVLVLLGCLLVLAASCVTFEPPKRPLCGPTHPAYLGGCDLVADSHDLP